jgi:hypothetical protein
MRYHIADRIRFPESSAIFVAVAAEIGAKTHLTTTPHTPRLAAATPTAGGGKRCFPARRAHQTAKLAIRSHVTPTARPDHSQAEVSHGRFSRISRFWSSGTRDSIVEM